MTTTRTDTHRMTWWAIVPQTRERIRRNARMNGGDWGWDVTCSCGWETRTGGAIEAEVRRQIADHRWDADHGYLES